MTHPAILQGIRALPAALLGAVVLLSPASAHAQDDVSPAPGLPDPCAAASEWSPAGPVALAHLQAFRGPLDYSGPRVVGCIRNDGSVHVEQMMLEFGSPPAPGSTGSGFGLTINVQLGGVLPGATVPFSSDETWGDMFTGRPTVDARLVGIDLLEKDTYNRPAFPVEAGPAVVFAPTDRPEHPLEGVCRAIGADAGDGEVWISEARLEVPAPGAAPVVVGCLTNRTGSPLGEEEGGRIPAQLEGIETAAPGGEGFVLMTGSLQMPAALEPGASSIFQSSFALTADLVDVTITPLRYDYEQGTAEVVGTPLRLRERR